MASLKYNDIIYLLLLLYCSKKTGNRPPFVTIIFLWDFRLAGSGRGVCVLRAITSCVNVSRLD